MDYPEQDKIHFIGEATIRYDDLGSGEIPLIFVHGFPFNKESWQSQVNVFSDTYRVIAYDIRGFGKSVADEKEASIALYADDLVHLMDGLNIETAVVCGLSMGGYIALNAIHRFPQRFSGLILADTQCIADTPEVHEDRVSLLEDIKVNGMAGFAKGFIDKIFSDYTKKENHILVQHIENLILGEASHIVMNAIKALSEREDTCSSLAQINVPTLILCGEEDKVTPLKQSEFLEKNIQGASLQTITNAGHLSNMEQPEQFNTHLEHFLAGIMAGAKKVGSVS